MQPARSNSSSVSTIVHLRFFTELFIFVCDFVYMRNVWMGAGVEQVHMDMAKNQVTVTGTMDAKALPEKLRKKLRRPVDVVQPNNNNKQQDKDGKDGKQQQQGEGGGGNKDGKQQQQGKEAAEKALAAEVELWKTAFYDQQSLLATEFMLSDENPNACAVM